MYTKYCNLDAPEALKYKFAANPLAYISHQEQLLEAKEGDKRDFYYYTALTFCKGVAYKPEKVLQYIQIIKQSSLKNRGAAISS